jgi:hypothetical protein
MNSLYTFGKLFHGLAFFGFCSTLGTGGTWGSYCYEHGFNLRYAELSGVGLIFVVAFLESRLI